MQTWLLMGSEMGVVTLSTARHAFVVIVLHIRTVLAAGVIVVVGRAHGTERREAPALHALYDHRLGLIKARISWECFVFIESPFVNNRTEVGYERGRIRTISIGADGGGTRTGPFFLSSLSPGRGS
jgi:hypothetical protein